MRLESLATPSREFGALQSMHHLSALGAALLHASPDPPPTDAPPSASDSRRSHAASRSSSNNISRSSNNHRTASDPPPHGREAWCVTDDALVSLSMRLMREGAAADFATDDARDGDGGGARNHNTGSSGNNSSSGIGSGVSTSRERAGWAARSGPVSALEATEVAAAAAAAAVAAEPSALLRARAEALLSTVRLCDGLFVSEALLRTEVRQCCNECTVRAFFYIHPFKRAYGYKILTASLHLLLQYFIL